MAKRQIPKVLLRPTSRGAKTSTQKAEKQERTERPPLPWRASKPKGGSDEENLYSQPGTVASRTRKHTPEQIEAAQRRMRGDVDDVDEVIDDDDTEEIDNDETEDDGGDEEQSPSERISARPNAPATMDDLQAILRSIGLSTPTVTTSAVQPQQPTQPTQADFEMAVKAEVARQMANAGAVAQTEPAPSPAAFLVAHPVSDADVDRLWDWLRMDPDSAHAFFNRMPQTSVELRRMISALRAGEENGIGMIRSLYFERTGLATKNDPSAVHFGFAMVAPMFTEERLALLHLYLERRWRGELASMIPDLLNLAATELPNFKLAIVPNGQSQLRLYGQLLPPLGFTTNTIFVR